MITLRIAADDTSRSVTLVAQTDGFSVSFLRRVGLTDEQTIVSGVPVVGGIASIVDASPPEKVLLSYAAVADDLERTSTATTVLPTTWSLTRPTLAGDIRLGDMVFNTIDDDGTVWTITDIDGWWTLPESEIPEVTRSRDEDGSYADSGRYLARKMTLTGVFLPPSSQFLESARRRLVEAVNAVRSTTALQVDETPPRQMQVRLNGKSQIATIRQSGLTQFTFELSASDPIKYGIEPMTQPAPNNFGLVQVGPGTASGGRTYPRDYDTDTDNVREYGTTGTPNAVQIFNEGDYVTPPFFRITGPVANPRIELVETGQQMEFVISLADGQYLEVDVHSKTVLLNGASSRRGTMTFDSEWMFFQPGINTIRYTALSSAGAASVLNITAYSAWLG